MGDLLQLDAFDYLTQFKDTNYKLFAVLEDGLNLFCITWYHFLICFYALIDTEFIKFKTLGRASI